MRERKEKKLPDIWKESMLKVAVALPLRMVLRRIPFLQARGLGVEVMLYDTNWICSWPKDKVTVIGRQLREAGIDVSVHGPVHDLNPGSLDVVIRDYTQHCFFKTLAICQALGAKNLVLHLGINPLLPESALDKWLESSVRTWAPIVDLAEQLQITIQLENMFLPTPKFMVTLKGGLASNAIKFCFDIGHFNVYSSVTLDQWLESLGSDIIEMHLNDNLGEDDEHLALGAGHIRFSEVFRKLSERRIFPRLTLEMTSDKFGTSLDYLMKGDLLSAFR
ncbi:MAG: sugar phosphate isomerase/epimerase [Candidatus Abyssobacteria bacterium SURF_5]|uniref:Sugar phosphate isomerase/epimerase n=1 Tax=Abyssobacteria bacterium (strain SURF_5) TaxID=2093360 RepID=A0A3A4P2F8_ABYX5|nr:MAG: sugar phosphate isomerase/epimerase [Candidatus Abyssubacteria bacterium SURF_5]